MHEEIGKRQPFPPITIIPEDTRYIPAGAITIGVGHRILTEKIADEYLEKVGYPRVKTTGYKHNDDGGVSIYVLDNERREHFRLDVFDAQPHYHYVFQNENAQARVLLDPVTTGDPMQWAMWCLVNRLPEILRHEGQPELAQKVDRQTIEAVLPKVAEAVKWAERNFKAAWEKERATSGSPS